MNVHRAPAVGRTTMGAMPDNTAPSPAVSMADLALGDGAGAYEGAVQRARDERWAERVWDRDPSVWSTNARVQATILERLGWLDAPAHFAEQVAALEGFGEGVPDARFTTAAVGGMGGTRLPPHLFHPP